MGIDPRFISVAAEGQAAARVADLERRAANLERMARIGGIDGAPPVPNSLTVNYDLDTKVTFRQSPAAGAQVVDKTNGRVYSFDGTEWKWGDPFKPVLGRDTRTASFATTSPHDAYQDEGLSVVVATIPDRLLRLLLKVNPQANGGANDVRYRILRDGNTISGAYWQMRPTGIESALWEVIVNSHSVAGSYTYSVQVMGAAANTQVTSYADGSFTRQLVVEDIGPVP